MCIPWPANSAPTQQTKDLRADTAWLSDVTSYEFTADFVFKMGGLTITIEVEHMALHSGYSRSVQKVAGLERRYICDRDSLWTCTPAFRNYLVEPRLGVAVGNVKAAHSFDSLNNPPYPFIFLQQVLMPEEDLEYEYESEGAIQINGRSQPCEIWHLTDDPDGEMADRIWIDPERRVVLMTQGSAKDNKTGAVHHYECRIKTLRIDAGLQPSDFVFKPESGFSRVSSPAKIYVSDSLEAESPPDVELHELEGGIISTGDWRGRVVVLDFWATWCSPCLKGLPHLQKLRQDYGDDVVIVGVTSEPLMTVERFLETNPSTYPILLDPESRASSVYRVSALPALYVIDAEGVVREHFVGLQTEDTIRSALGRMGVEPGSE